MENFKPNQQAMADLDSSLRRSLVLGRQVLERASRHRVDWTRVRDADRRLGPTPRDDPDKTPAPRDQSSVELKAAFSSITDFMTHTSALCQRYHGSLSSLSDAEQSHVCRFHHHRSGRHSAFAPEPQREDDFAVEVFPGTYSVTASDPEAPPRRPLNPGDSSPRQQTQLVSLGAGQSALLTFDL